MMPKHKTTREEKIAYTLRLFDPDNNGEVVAAVHALKRLLQSMGTDRDGHPAHRAAPHQ
jgi:Ca2+-binding EF-hand superfamily protein